MPEPKKTLAFAPSLLVTLLGGTVGAVLLAALVLLPPELGLPQVDLLRLVGGVFTGDTAAALWVGLALLFLTHGLVLPALLSGLLWNLLPGGQRTLTGAALRGVLLGLGLWALSGLLLPLLGALNQVLELERPGLFGTRAGPAAVAWLALPHVAYGLAVALVAWMSQGLSPLDTLGWKGVGRQGASHEPA